MVNVSGQLLIPEKACNDTSSIHVQFTPNPTQPSPLLLAEVQKAGQHKTDVRVTQKQGYFCHIEASILLELPPANVYEVLTHPHNHDIFQAQKECTYRKVVSDDGDIMTVEVEHSAAWNFLFLSGTFHTRLRVEQSQIWGKVTFHLVKSAVLNKFDGEWTMIGVVETSDANSPTHTLLKLRQDMLPTIIPPAPADRLFRRLLGKQIETMLCEIQGEVENIRNGKPCLTYPPDQYEHINAEPRPLTASLARPRSHVDLATPFSTAAAIPRRRSIHAHSIMLEEQDLAELDLDWEDDEATVVFYDCLDEAESFHLLIERAGSSGMKFQHSETWLQRHESLNDEEMLFMDAQEELYGDARA